MSTPFDFEKYESAQHTQPKPFNFEQYEPDERTFGEQAKSAAAQYATGVGGGAGGAVPDVLNLIQSIPGLGGIAGEILKSQKPKFDGSEEIANKIAEDFNVDKPINSLERILKESGKWGGQEGIIGTGVGGPIGGGLGLAHGSASGAFYGGLKELGANDELALGATMLLTLSPIAFQKLLPKIQEKLAKSTASSKSTSLPKQPPPPPGTTPTPPTSAPIDELLQPKSPETLFETAERAIKESQGAPIIESPSGTSAISLPKEQGAPLEGRVQTAAKEPKALQKPLGTSELNAPKEEHSKAIEPSRVSKEPELGHSITKDRFESDASGGTTIEKKVKEMAAEERAPVNKAYEVARKETQTSHDIYPDLARKNDELIDRLEKVQKRNSGEEAVYQQALNIRNMVGRSGEYIEQNAERLLAQSDSMSKLANYEMPYTGYKGILKKLVKDINNSVIGSLKRQGKKYRAVEIADEKFAKWADKFLGDEIQPFLEKKILNPEALYNSAVKNPGNYRAVENAIGKSNPALIEKIDRAIVEDRLGKYWQNPEKIGTEEFNKSIRDLKQLIGSEKTDRAFEALQRKSAQFKTQTRVKEAGERSKYKAAPLKEKVTAATQLKAKTPRPSVAPEKGRKILPERISSATANKSAKIMNSTPSEIVQKTNTPEGLRELKKSLPESTYKELSEQKLRSVLREGHIEKEVTSKEIYDFLNKEDTYQLFAEVLGKEEVHALRDVAKKSAKLEADKQFTHDLIRKFVKQGVITAVKGTVAMKALKILLKLML